MSSKKESWINSDPFERLLLETDLAYFAERILDMEIGAHHKEWSSHCAQQKRLALLAPRDHGKCLSARSLVLMADGSWKPISEIEAGEFILSEGRPYRVLHRWTSGKKPLYRLTVSGGRSIESTAEHKFWKNDWKPLSELKAGDRILVPNSIDPVVVSSIRDSEIKLLAFAIAEGSMTGSNFHISNKNPKIIKEIKEASQDLKFDAIYYKRYFYSRIIGRDRKYAKVGSPQEWARKYKIWGKYAYDKRVPKEVFTATQRQVCLFLNRFWACDGWVSRTQIGVTLANEKLIDDLQRLLMRIGVYGRKSIKRTSSGRPTFGLLIQNVSEQKRFLDHIGLIFTKEDQSRKLLERISSIKPITRDIKRVNSHYSEVKIEKIEYIGEEEVFDIEVEGKHEFVADGFRVHNSYFFSFAFVIWRIYFAWKPSIKDIIEVNPDPKAAKNLPKIPVGYIFSNTQPQAIAFLDIIKTELMSNPKLQHLVPKMKESWSKLEIKTSNGVIVKARGYGSAVRGAHPSWVVCDDVLNDESIYSELTRKKQLDYFYSALTPLVVPGGQIVVVGTPFHSQDLYQHLKENRKYFFKRYFTTPEQPLWPARYSQQMLEDKREEIGSTRFSREFGCLPISDESSLFTESMLQQCFDNQFTMPKQLTSDLRSQFQGVYVGMDLALSANVGADYTVITTIGVDQHKNYWILDIRRKKGIGMTEQLHLLQDVNSCFRPDKIFVEDNSYQRVFRDEIVRSTDMPVEGFTTTAYNKNTLERGVPSLQILFENRKIIIPRKEVRDRELTDALCHELKCFTWLDGKLQGVGAHDDMVMSFYLAKECASSSSFTFTFD